MGKMHEVLAVEKTVVGQASKLVTETMSKFSKHSEFFTGNIRTLTRLRDTAEDKAIEQANKSVKELPTTVIDTLDYIFPFMRNALDVKLTKHLTNQVAVGDIVMDGVTIATDVPVDFLLDLEKEIPKMRDMFAAMPTLDPSKQWDVDRTGVHKTNLQDRVQDEKVVAFVEASPATDKHPAQVKEISKSSVVGIFKETVLSGAATTEQKADVLALCDKLLGAVVQTRMRANSAEQKNGMAAAQIIGLFQKVFK